ncbi:MAG: hypothetical protein ACREP9_11765 [Candidatus Dormibacteraceae bacterium]
MRGHQAFAQQTATVNGQKEYTNEVKVIAADNPINLPFCYGQPAGNPVGLQTVYCDTVQGGQIILDHKRPTWVDIALRMESGENGATPAVLLGTHYSRSYQFMPIVSTPPTVPAKK